MPTGGRATLKRPDRPGDENTPVRVKRRRSVAGSHVMAMEQEDTDFHQVCFCFLLSLLVWVLICITSNIIINYKHVCIMVVSG